MKKQRFTEEQIIGVLREQEAGAKAARSAIAEWADDYNNFRPHSSLGYQTPADYAGIIAATGSNATQCGSFAFPPVAPTAPFGVTKNAEALIAAG